MIDATVIEWFGGHFIEHFYHERWWDYSKNKWNLDGYICLSHSVFWGLLGYIGVKFVNPLLFKFYHLIPPFIRHLIIFILLAVLIIDILATTIVVFGKNIDKRRWESADAYLTKISVKLSSLITSCLELRESIRRIFRSLSSSLTFLSDPHRSVSVSGRCMALKFCITPFEHILSKTQNPKFLTLVILTRNIYEVK